MNIASSIERFIVDEIMIKDRQTRLSPEQSLISTGVLDSIGLLRLISFIEEQFGVVVDDSEVVPDNFQTLDLITGFVKGKMSVD